ncbi:MAG: tetratricopeptide repeat protein [Acidobacteria bacterium]|nr:tetratricopeptide repeat protein [Acidobacteriota bacterium]
MQPLQSWRSNHPLCQSGCTWVALCLWVLVGNVTAVAQGSGGAAGSSGSRTNTGTNSIRGKVFLPSGLTPEQRLRVVLEISTGGIAAETFTDSVGNFDFRSVANNNYRVTIYTDQRLFETTQETLEVYGNFARTYNVQIYLREKWADTLQSKDKMLSVADTQEAPKSAKKLYEKGLKLAREGKPQEAVGPLKEALQAFPAYMNALNKLGEQHLRLAQPAEAQALFERALAVNDKFALPHINLGILLLNLKRVPEAIKELETGNNLDDSFPMGHVQLGLALMLVEPLDYERVEKEFKRALQIAGKEIPQAHLHLFNLYTRHKEYQKALTQLDEYLKDAPNTPEAEVVRQKRDALRKVAGSR